MDDSGETTVTGTAIEWKEDKVGHCIQQISENLMFYHMIGGASADTFRS